MSETTEKWLKRMSYYQEVRRPGDGISLVAFIKDICEDVERLEQQVESMRRES